MIIDYCCESISKIENYELALKCNFKGWDCHHRLETHNSDGERRLVDITQKELKALGMYYNRPAEELIFMTRKEHRQLHMKDKPAWNKGLKMGPWTEEQNKRRSATMKGMKHSKERNAKISDAMKGKPSNVKGKHWKLVEGKRCYY
jgi:hypothetical protein